MSTQFEHNIEFVDATPGTGKTEAAVAHMARHLLEDRQGIVVYVAPTVKLLEKVRDDRLIPMMRAHKANARQLASVHLHASKNSPSSGSVVRAIMRDLSGSREASGNIIVSNKNNCVLLITHASFFRLPLKLANKENVEIIFDEARKCVFEPARVELTENEIKLFNDYLVEETLPQSSEYRRIQFDMNPDKLIDLKAQMAKWKKKRKVAAAAYGRFISMVDSLELGTTEVYCLRTKPSAKSKATFKFYEVHIPSKVFFGWRRVIIMSAYLRQTQLWAMLCRSAFGLNGRVCRMTQKEDGSWYPGPARRHVLASCNLQDITMKFIPSYRKRQKQIMDRYSHAVIVSLTGSSKITPLPKHLISSSKLNGIFVKDKKAAERYGEQFKQICLANADKIKTLTSKDLKRILHNTDSSQETLSAFARKLRDWVHGLDKVADYPYLWYLTQGLHVAKQWFKSKSSSPIPLLLGNKGHMRHLQATRPMLSQSLRVLPHSCHGRDDFKDHCMILFQAATNPTPEARSFYESQIPWYDYNQDHVVDTALQAATRTSIRDTNNTEPVLIVVPDPYLAKLVSDRLGGVPIEYASEKYGVKGFAIIYVTKPDLSAADRMQKHRESATGKQSAALASRSPFFKKLNSTRMKLSRARKADSPDVAALEAEAAKLSKAHSAWMKENRT